MIDNKYENFTDMLDEYVEQDYLEESKKRDKINYDALDNQIRVFFGHLIKFEKQKIKQSRSWVLSIRDSSVAITKAALDKNGNIRGNVYNHITDNMYALYLSGVELANDDAGTTLVNPAYARIPKEFTIYFMLNLYEIGKWMYRRTDKNEIKDYINGYFGYYE